MKGGRFIERQAGHAVLTRQGRMQGDAAAVGVTNQMHLALAAVDDIDGPCRLVGQRESMRATPGPCGLRAVVLGRKQLVLAAEGIAECPPLTGASPRAVQGDNRVASAARALNLRAWHVVLRSPFCFSLTLWRSRIVPMSQRVNLVSPVSPRARPGGSRPRRLAPRRRAGQAFGDTNDTIRWRQEMPALQALAMMARSGDETDGAPSLAPADQACQSHRQS